MSFIRFLCKIIRRIRGPEARMVYDLSLGDFQLKETTMNTVNLNTAQKIKVTARPMIGHRPATIDGRLGISTDNQDIANFEIDSEDSNSFTVYGVSPGTAVITITADADLDEDETREITDSFTVVVTQAEADRLELEFGEVQPAD